MKNTNVGQILPDNLINCHSRVLLSGIPTLNTQNRGDLQLRALGMTLNFNNTPSPVPTGHLPPHGEAANFNAASTWREKVECVSPGVRGKSVCGFTLIELLVVVLIIGILAAVAVPSYQKSVLKSRFASLKPLTNSIAQAEELYYLENGSYADQWTDLSFSLEKNQASEDINCDLRISAWGKEGIVSSVSCSLVTKGNMEYEIILDHSDYLPGNRRCTIRETTDKSDWRNTICQAETGKKNGKIMTSYGGYIYYTY